MKSFFSLIFVFNFFFIVFSQSNKTEVFAIRESGLDADSLALNIHHLWLKQAGNLTKNTVGFTAPVSARAYAYITLAMFESNVFDDSKNESLSNQLNAFKRTIWLNPLKSSQSIDKVIIANRTLYKVISYLYRAMPSSNQLEIESMYDSINNECISIANYQSSYNLPMILPIDKLLSFSDHLADEIIAYSKLDGADTSFRNNYPVSFDPPKCIECWTKTTPGYLRSLLPYWGMNRQFLKNSHLSSDGCELFEFSSDSTSNLYKDALGVYENSKSSDKSFEIIAEYWDDSPGYSGTPAGHFFSIAIQLVNNHDLKLKDALEFYLLLGISMNEANIICWRLKYKYNFIRPISYIHRYIDPYFNTRINTPPFPEFPSGHSYQAGSAVAVFKYVFGDDLDIIDDTHSSRSDIDGESRKFEGFDEMGEEASISRYYGGIHFKKTLDLSLFYGKEMGKYVINQLKFEK